MTVQDIPSDPENDFGDFQSAVVELVEQERAARHELCRLADIAIQKGWVSTMAELCGVARSTIYDWASVHAVLGNNWPPDIPEWLVIAAVRMAKQVSPPSEIKKLALAILDYCVANGVTPSALMNRLRNSLPPVTGRGTAKYVSGNIVITPLEETPLPYEKVRFTLNNDDESQERPPDDLQSFINRILGSGQAGS